MLDFVGSSLRELKSFPRQVQRRMGYALREAEEGRKHISAIPLKGFGGAAVLEIIEDYDGDTFRAVYTVKFEGVVYVLHAFQKKSKQGRTTPQRDRDLIQRRLEMARELYAHRSE